jgi:signal transduction histidine kinase
VGSWGRLKTIDEREEDVAAREARVAAQEERLREREDVLRAREQAVEGDPTFLQMREINERLVIATVRADEVAEAAKAQRATIAARAVALQAQDRAKDEFLAMLGHELRNPLTPILGMLDVMQLRAPDVLCTERRVIEGQVRQLVRLVDEMLDLARVNEGKVTLRVEPLDVGDVVARAVETVAAAVEQKQLALNVSVVAPTPLVVDGDLVRLTQTVGNLLTNAVKYTPEHGAITVSAVRRGATIAIDVRDTGIGISPEMLPQVFDLFAQESRGLDRSEGGLGLGLTIAQRLARMHGGRIAARSAGVGEGSWFELVLPASDRAVSIAHSDTVLPTVRALKILVVDDNVLASEAIQILLEMLGHDVRTCGDGITALEVAATFGPDVAMLDIGLPRLDGYQLAQRVQAQWPHVYLIAVTGYGRDVDRERSHEVGFAQHLVKPIDFDMIKGCLARMVSART